MAAVENMGRKHQKFICDYMKIDVEIKLIEQIELAAKDTRY